MLVTYLSDSHAMVYMLVAVGCLVGTLIVIQSLRQLSFWRCTVVDTNDTTLLASRGNGIRQNPAEPRMERFHAQIAHVLRPGSPTVENIARLRQWARAQQREDPELWVFPRQMDSGDVDPEILLQQQRAQLPGACRRFGYVLAGALVSAGIPARLVSLQADFTDQLGHIMVEAWVDEMNKWVLVDPTFDTMFLINGQYASLLEVREALRSTRAGVEFERNGSTLVPHPTIEYFTQISQHAFVFTRESYFTDPPRTKASVWGTELLHFVDEHAGSYPSLYRIFALAAAAALTGCGTMLMLVSLLPVHL